MTRSEENEMSAFARAASQGTVQGYEEREPSPGEGSAARAPLAAKAEAGDAGGDPGFAVVPPMEKCPFRLYPEWAQRGPFW
jgi:hypothetical protein